MLDRVAVSGLGVVSPFGPGTPRLWEGLIGDRPAFTPVRDANARSGNRLWAAVPDDFAASDAVPSTVLRNADRFTQLALVATDEAMRDAGMQELPELGTAVVIGSTMGGVPLLARTAAAFAGSDRQVSPKLMALVIPNMASARIALQYKLHGPQLTISTACASSLDAIGMAAGMIERGEVEVAIAGGVETLLDALVYESLAKAGALSRTSDPLRACRPFDVQRDGFVMGEGAAVVVLEHVERLRARGRTPRARIRGYASIADSYHLTAPDPSGTFEALAMARALDGMDPRTVAVLYAHGTSTVVGDAAEIAAVNVMFPSETPLVITSLKGHMGHAMAAAGAFSVVAGILGMERSVVPQTLGTRNLESDVRFDVVTRKHRDLDYERFMVNAFGFGGQNASFVVTR